MPAIRAGQGRRSTLAWCLQSVRDDIALWCAGRRQSSVSILAAGCIVNLASFLQHTAPHACGRVGKFIHYTCQHVNRSGFPPRLLQGRSACSIAAIRPLRDKFWLHAARRSACIR